MWIYTHDQSRFEKVSGLDRNSIPDPLMCYEEPIKAVIFFDVEQDNVQRLYELVFSEEVITKNQRKETFPSQEELHISHWWIKSKHKYPSNSNTIFIIDMSLKYVRLWCVHTERHREPYM